MFRLLSKARGHISKAGIAQLVEHHLAKVEVASSSLVSRSISMTYETRSPPCLRKLIVALAMSGVGGDQAFPSKIRALVLRLPLVGG